MTPYIVLLILLLFFVYREGFLTTYTAKRNNLILALLPVFFMLAFKGESVGIDTSSYILHFDISTDWKSNSDGGYDRIEKGFTLFLFFLHKISDNAIILFISTSLLLCFSMYIFIKENSSKWALTLFFFVTMGFFQFALSGVRQTMAISITLITYHFVKKKRWVYVLMGIVLAYFFHKSSVVYILAILIANMDLSGRKLKFWGLIMFISLFAIEKILLFIGGMLSYDYGVEETGNGYIFFAIVLIITFFAQKRKKQILTLDDSSSMILNINLLTFLMWVIRLFSRTAERMSFYFMPYTYVTMTQLIESFPNENRNSIKHIIIILCMVLFFYRMQGVPFNPYLFYF
ncbi:EpsG family protein [uncultured Bacteroides sp.]|uniref:EpsG family protein n=1 Tax=uncultured Bacteroides sp. TaxID=162156 RepID=UPI0025EA8B9F|nr:EpsG family protein [uncultured Bacteroides sp.]